MLCGSDAFPKPAGQSNEKCSWREDNEKKQSVGEEEGISQRGMRPMKLQTHALFPLTQTPISEYSGVRINEAIAKDNTTTQKLLFCKHLFFFFNVSLHCLSKSKLSCKILPICLTNTLHMWLLFVNFVPTYLKLLPSGRLLTFVLWYVLPEMKKPRIV